MLDSVELVNWKTHGKTKITFTRGTNILIGHMGAGKSSVMDAISFALFGTFPALRNGRVKIDDIVRNKPKQTFGAKVRLVFTVGKEPYIVERELTPGQQAKARLEKEGEYLQSQPKRVTEEIEKLLKADYDLFSRAVYSEQNNLDYFLQLTPGERKRQMDNLLGLDKFAAAQENASSLVNRLRDMADEQRSAAAGFDIDAQRSQLASLTGEESRLNAEKAELAAGLERINKEAEKRGLEIGELRRRHSRKTLLVKELEGLKGRLEALSREIVRIEAQGLLSKGEIEDRLKNASLMHSQANEARSKQDARFRDLQQRVGGCERELSGIGKEIEEMERIASGRKENAMENAEKKIAETEERIDGLRKEEISNQAALNENRKWITELGKGIAMCPICKTPLDEMRKGRLLLEKEKSAEEAERKMKAAIAGIKIEDAELKVCRKELEKIRAENVRLQDYGKKLERRKYLSLELQEVKTLITVVSAELEKTKEDEAKTSKDEIELKSAKEKAERLLSYLKESEEARKAAAEKEAEVASIDVDESLLEKKQAEFVELNTSRGKMLASLSANEKAIAEKSRQIGDKRSEIERIEKILAGMKRKVEVAEELVKFRNSLQETQGILRNRLVNSINDIMQGIWCDLYPYGDYSSVALSAAEGDYVLQVKSMKNGEHGWQSVESIASGGERSIACLALRIAFSLVLAPNLRWLILDEPTHNIDSSGIGKLVAAFSEKLPEMVEQVFIITHDEQLKQVSNGRLYSLGRNKAENAETVVEQL